uniref:Uncharacterized protein n=1 Tax=Octopus bimaculoides TaxID=37653 RepID=A0A0L8G1S0_OCTBM
MGRKEAFPERSGGGGEHVHRVRHLLPPDRRALSRPYHHQTGAHPLPLLVERKRSDG